MPKVTPVNYCTACGVGPRSELLFRKRRNKWKHELGFCAFEAECRKCMAKRSLGISEKRRSVARNGAPPRPMRADHCTRCGVGPRCEPLFRKKRDAVGVAAFHSRCKKCDAQLEVKMREKRFALDPARFREAQLRQDLRRHFALSLEDYREKYAAQLGRCQICETPMQRDSGGAGPGGRAHVDHDHKSGETRGLLCHDCNLGLGRFKDNPRLLEKAVRYLSLRIYKEVS